VHASARSQSFAAGRQMVPAVTNASAGQAAWAPSQLSATSQSPVFARQMIDLMGDHDIAVMEIDGFAHPLSAVYRRATLPHVEALLARDRLRPVFLFDAVRTRRVQPAEMTAVDPELLTLRNLNTREDYMQALASAGLADPAR